jgi:hypothetical protein
MRRRLHKEDTTVITPPFSLDDTFGELTYKYPVKVQEWLDKYGLTELELVRNEIQWSEDRQFLIIPVIDHISSKPIAYNCRYFGDDPKVPKYINEYPQGRAQTTKFTFRCPPRMVLPSLVLVEDQISAIKVSRQASCVALLGTHIPTLLFHSIVLHGLSHSIPILVWLDPDKHTVSVKYSRLFRQYIRSYPILSDKDPKYYNDEEINGFISKALGLCS